MEQQTFDAAGMIAEVAKRASQQPIPERYPEAPAQSAIPSWFIRRRPSGGTWTTNTDWVAQFYAPEATYYDSTFPCGGGWISFESEGVPTMFQVLFESDTSFSEVVYVEISSPGGRMQVQCNGLTSAAVNELTATGTLTINVREGTNTLSVMTNDVDMAFTFTTNILAKCRYIPHDPPNLLLSR